MILKQDIKIGNHTYQTYLYKDTDLYKDYIYVMNYDIVDDAPVIHDIYFIDAGLKNDVWRDIIQGNKLQEVVTYPVINNYDINEGFSTDIRQFNDDIKTLNLNNTLNLKSDRIRIYHPQSKKKLNCVIYVYAIVNDVKIHLYCRNMNQLTVQGDSEFRKGHDLYSEYVEFSIPNFEQLISDDSITVDFLGDSYQLDKVIMPFYIQDGKTVYIDEDYYELTNIISTPVTLLMFPYGEIDRNIYKYILSDDYEPNCDSFNKDQHIELCCRLDFDPDNQLSIYGQFMFNQFIDETEVGGLYEIIYNVRESDYIDQGMCFLKLEIAADNAFRNVIYESDDSDYAMDFIDNEILIPLQGLYSSWDELPPMLNIRVTFIDAMINNSIVSNTVHMTKEYYKYLIKDTDDTETMEIQDGTFNLIDKVQCYVTNRQSFNSNISKAVNSPRVIIKPIFYKVSDLQNISMRTQLTQNVGINLSDYMSKVETFRLSIEGSEYTEYARNDIYVIFRINTVNITSSAGTYHILDQDGEYISSGKYTVS